MGSKRKFFLIFCFCILNMFLLVGFFVIRDATMLNVLHKEESELLKITMTNGKSFRKIQSRGNYAVVEKSIKDYLDTYSFSLQEVLGVMDDEYLKNILSYDNYCKDGPGFSKSLSYLKNQKENVNQKIEQLTSMSEENTIRKNISGKIQDPYYADLYYEFMLSEDMKKKFSDNNTLLNNTKMKINHVIDVSTEVLNFLVTNQDSWKVEDNKIQFLTDDLYNQYMSYISKLS